jgi:hypothetical protein
MINEPDRIPPADPWSIQLTYRHDQRWWFDANQEPETWKISADIYDDSGTRFESHVGDISIVTVDIYDAHDPFGLLDGEGADLGLIAEAIFDPATGCLHPELELRPRRAARRNSDQETVRRRPGRHLLPSAARRRHTR